MAGTALTMTFEDGPLVRHLARLSARQEWTKARRDIGEFMVGDIQDNLDGQKLFDGSPMPQSKAAIKRRGKTLIKDHHLYDSYTYNLVGGGLEVGSNKVYAAIQHFGGETGRGHKTKIEARPVMGIAIRQELQIGYIVSQAIRDIERAQ
ncbi:phage virion morphogenesis protein [Rhodoferax sp.]|uniref:phage virion morphogenesis protein n=1 Tax=Rhodoferax sp. TaxID=50421 RepID=UPI00284C6A7F|nr:phage virion morphogenesis protein [Rhodoferax sp.]MDR3370714.1 phage virion morphogenesis protein [Rhodoferax sp.]